MKLSLNKAAQHYRISKSTLSEALNTGRLSASKDDRGRWQIEPSEMDRVFPLNGAERSSTRSPNPHENHAGTTEYAIKVGRLEAELEAQQQVIAAHEAMISDLKDQRDKWQATADRLLLQPPQENAAKPERRGFFARFMG